MSATKNKLTKVPLNCRLAPLVKALINLERDSGGHNSEGEAVEALVLRASDSPAAHQLVLAQAEKDPMYAALRNALSAQPPAPDARRISSSNRHPADQATAELAAIVNPFAASGIKSGSTPKARPPGVAAGGRQRVHRTGLKSSSLKA